MRRVIPITAALATLAGVPGANAQVTSSPESARSPWERVGRDTASVASTDTAFIRQTIRGHFTEVALGRLADSRAEADAVEDFAERMVTDHNEMNEKWADLARQNDMSVGIDFGPVGEQTIERIEDLSGSEFDQAYMTEMIRLHEQDLAGLQRMATSARSSEVRQLASSGATTIRNHLALARQVGTQVGIATTAGRVAGVPAPAPTSSDDDGDTRRGTIVGRATAGDADDRDGDDRDRNDRSDRERRSLRGEDRAFVDNVLSDHLMHVRLARQARREANASETRSLAERIERDFENWSERWERFADRRNADVTARLERHNREKLVRLEKAKERKDFDRAYAAIVADHLESMVDDFREEANEDRPGAVRRLIQDELPVLREHLARARRIERQAENKNLK